MVEIKLALKIEGLNITLYQGYSVGLYTKCSHLKPDLGILFIFTWIEENVELEGTIH